MRKITGDEPAGLISKQKEFNKTKYGGSYVLKGQSYLLKTFDPFWTNLVKNSKGKIRICHHNDNEVYCGRCFQ